MLPSGRTTTVCEISVSFHTFTCNRSPWPTRYSGCCSVAASACLVWVSAAPVVAAGVPAAASCCCATAAEHRTNMARAAAIKVFRRRRVELGQLTRWFIFTFSEWQLAFLHAAYHFLPLQN